MTTVPRLLLSLLVSHCVLTAAHAERQSFNFNPAWRLAVADPASASESGFDDRAWKTVTLPRAWNEDDAFGKDIVDHLTGFDLYR